MIIYMIFFLIIIVIFLIYGYLSNFNFKVTEYKLNSKELYNIWKNKKIIVISDLHNCKYGNNNQKLISKINNINPEYIIVAGDIVNDKSNDNNEFAQKLISELESKYKILYADGNHEQGFFKKDDTSFDEDRFYKFYGKEKYKSNLLHLNNEYIQIENIRIYGLQIGREYYNRTTRPEFNQQYLKKLIGKSQKNCYNIIIAHNPMYFEDYAKWGADVVISGHLHGGFIRIPGIGGVISPQLKLFPKYSGGLYRYNNSTLILSRGLGMHTLKLRIFNPPELVVVSFDE